jgi:hypothetical protein
LNISEAEDSSLLDFAKDRKKSRLHPVAVQGMLPCLKRFLNITTSSRLAFGEAYHALKLRD